MRLERWNPRSGSVMEWGPFAPVAGLSRLMDEVFGALPFGDAVAEARWSPKVDVYEKDDAFVVKADVPGVKAEDIELSVLGDVLTIRGQRNHEAEATAGKTYRVERAYGTFSRQILLPPSVDSDSIRAAYYKDGVLEVSLPKKAAAKPREVKVDTA